jgi:hypothetical protein
MLTISRIFGGPKYRLQNSTEQGKILMNGSQ